MGDGRRGRRVVRSNRFVNWLACYCARKRCTILDVFLVCVILFFFVLSLKLKFHCLLDCFRWIGEEGFWSFVFFLYVIRTNRKPFDGDVEHMRAAYGCCTAWLGLSWSYSGAGSAERWHHGCSAFKTQSFSIECGREGRRTTKNN